MYKKKLPLGIRIVFGFLSVLLCICLFATTLVTIVVADLNTVTSKDGLQTIINQVLFPKSAPVRVTPKLSGGAMAGIGDFSGIDFSSGNLDQNALIDSIYDMVAQQSGGELPISKEEVGELLEETTIPDFITDKMSSIVSDVITGEVTTTITKEEVMELIEENAAVIEEKLDIKLAPEDIESVGTWIEETEVMDTVQQEINTAIGVTPPEVTPGGSGDSSEGVSPSPVKPHKAPTTILDVIGPDVKVPTNLSEGLVLLRAISSTDSLLICIGACVAIFLLLLLTHWGRPFAAIRSAGIPIMIAGIVMLLPGLLSAFIPAGNMMVLNIIQKVLGMTLTVSVIVALVGLAMIISGGILNRVFKLRAKVRAAFATAPVAAPVYAPVAPAAPATYEAPVAPVVEAPVVAAVAAEAAAEEAVEAAPVEEPVAEEPAAEEPVTEETAPAEEEQTPAAQE